MSLERDTLIFRPESWIAFASCVLSGHDWGDWYYSESQKRRMCDHCGLREKDTEPLVPDGGTPSDGVEREDVLRGAVEVWGEDLQIDIAIEELSELTTELARRQRGRESYSATVEEIADVQLCLDQLKLMYGREHVELAEESKLDRLASRGEADRDE